MNYKNHKRILKTMDGFKISSIHTTSKRQNVILWLHGITVNKNEYLDFFKDGAEYVATNGTDSLRIDFRGHGDSSGTSLDFTITGQMIDIESALEYLNKEYDFTKVNLHIVGCSFGAPPAIFTAIRYPKIVKSVFLIAPVLSYDRTFLTPETEWAKSIFNKKTFAALTKKQKLFINNTFPIGIQLIEEMRLIHPEIDIMKVKQNITIIHGNADSMVPYSASKKIADDNPNIKLVTIPEMDHGFTDAKDEIGNSQKSLKNKKFIYELISKKLA